MTNLADRWGIHPDHPWLRGRQPAQIVKQDAATGMWNVYGYPEVLQILGDTETFTSDVTRLFPPELAASSEGDLTLMDGPMHRKLRKLASHAFTPKTVADLEPRIAELTAELLDAVDGDRFDMVATLAFPLPVIVIAELLGVPASDRDMFGAMVNDVLDLGAEMAANPNGETEENPQTQSKVESMNSLKGYLLQHATERRKQPRQDLLTRLVEAEVDGDRLSDSQVVSFAALLLAAGFITTAMLLGNTMLCLDAFPEQVALVRKDRSRVPAVIEESLRFLSPVAMGIRATNSEVELAGQRIPADRLVQIWMAAANRDPRQFARPNEFDPDRKVLSHLSFGRGAHFCMGAPLARLEGRVALNLVLDRFESLRVDPDNPPAFMTQPAFTGPMALTLLTR